MDSRESDKDKTSEEAKKSGELMLAIDLAIETMKGQLGPAGTLKGSIGDLVRLLQLRKELEGERPRRVSARWIDECPTSTEE